jgi:hypothetical protein
MVYGFIKQSGGHVEIESRSGKGTTIRIWSSCLSCRRLESREGTMLIGRALASAMRLLAKWKQAFQSVGLTN